jgi:type I restriction enzyme M protein
MADNRKEQERAELHRTIWNIANDLRGSVGGKLVGSMLMAHQFIRQIMGFKVRQQAEHYSLEQL